MSKDEEYINSNEPYASKKEGNVINYVWFPKNENYAIGVWCNGIISLIFRHKLLDLKKEIENETI